MLLNMVLSLLGLPKVHLDFSDPLQATLITTFTLGLFALPLFGAYLDKEHKEQWALDKCDLVQPDLFELKALIQRGEAERVRYHLAMKVNIESFWARADEDIVATPVHWAGEANAKRC